MGAPSEAFVAAAMAVRDVTDAQGRVLTVRRLNALDKLRLFKAAGASLAQNAPWLGMALLACSVTAIDDVPVPVPINEQQIESLVQRLGDAGIAALGAALAGDAAPIDRDHAKN
jgi:hypothetical protein